MSGGAEDIKAGDILLFGSYEQDGDSGNGKEPVEWIVLSRDGQYCLLISRYLLDAVPYNGELTDITWEECSLRSWLNDEFCQKAFSDAEQARIKTTHVVNDDNYKYGTHGGNDTEDRVFLLSLEEVLEYFHVDPQDGRNVHDSLTAVPTAYAVARGAAAYDHVSYGNDANYSRYDGCGWWYLRSPGYYSLLAAYVNIDGSIRDNGSYVDNPTFSVRPVMWVRMK